MGSCSPKILEHTSTQIQYSFVHDTVSNYQRDSIYINKYQKGDTIFIEKFKYLTQIKYKEHVKIDTSYIKQTVTVQVEKKLSIFIQFCRFFTIMTLFIVLFYIISKFKLF